ncbi:hypothetical protein CYMTET_21918 [Cymbomonas tetramitiformis]|uniref:Uncharacterized protein n=1 Tax=Cymbomonas tetramitiformis TaxID=36881 RepID=A0AAE0G1L4_9CHLO|nr:hypothetical protein CYMTET_21918 [Cymbomonas tetramitiformis]
MVRLTKAEQKTAAKTSRSRLKQHELALEWCHANKKGARAACATGLWPPLVTRNSLDKRLQGRVSNGMENAARMILTPEDEKSIAKYLILKNLCGDGEGRDHLGSGSCWLFCVLGKLPTAKAVEKLSH